MRLGEEEGLTAAAAAAELGLLSPFLAGGVRFNVLELFFSFAFPSVLTLAACAFFRLRSTSSVFFLSFSASVVLVPFFFFAMLGSPLRWPPPPKPTARLPAPSTLPLPAPPACACAAG